jgi:hypothetical protein
MNEQESGNPKACSVRFAQLMRGGGIGAALLRRAASGTVLALPRTA